MSILLISPKNKYATRRLMEEAGKMSVPITVMDVKELAARDFQIDVNQFSVLYVRFAYPYFAQVIDLAKKFKAAGKRVIDENFIVSGFETSKWQMYQQLKNAGLPIPATHRFSDLSLKAISYKLPAIIKWQYGYAGHHVHLATNQTEFDQAIAQYPAEEIFVQEYIKPKAEYMTLTIGYKCLPKILKFEISNLKFKIDPHKYSILEASRHPELVSLVQRAAKATGRELAKIDLIEDQSGNFYILEVNRSASLLPFEPYTKINVSREYIEYLVK